MDMAARDTTQECSDDREVVLLLNEIEYARNRLENAIAGPSDRSSLVSALLGAIESHARVRRLAAHLLAGKSLIAVNCRLEELWALIQAQS